MRQLTVGKLILMFLFGLVIALFGPMIPGIVLGYAFAAVVFRGLQLIIDCLFNNSRDD